MKLQTTNYKLQTCSGQLLVESMVAISVIITGLFGILLLLANSLGLNKVVSDQYVGIYLASEGIEVMRAIVDADFNSGVPIATTYLALDGICGFGCIVQYDTDDTAELVALQPTGNPTIHFDGTYYNHDTGLPATLFQRTLFVNPFDLDGDSVSDGLIIRSSVSWTGRGGGEFSAELVDQFYNWRQ